MQTAYLESETYPISETPFYIVRCDDPSHGPIALNSGHHYEDKAQAEDRAAAHDAEEHPAKCHCGRPAVVVSSGGVPLCDTGAFIAGLPRP